MAYIANFRRRPLGLRTISTNSTSPLYYCIAPLFNETRMTNPISIYRASISFCLIVIQLSVASGALNNVEQIQSRSDPSSPLSLFPAPDDSGFTGSLDLSSSEGLMVPFNNNGEDSELASVDKNCASGAKRRGKWRARRGDHTSCPSDFQVRQISTRERSRI